MLFRSPEERDVPQAKSRLTGRFLSPGDSASAGGGGGEAERPGGERGLHRETPERGGDW